MISAPKESILRAGLDASEYTRGAAEIDRANTEIAAGSGKVEQSQERMTRSLTTSQASMDRLQASLDKGFAAQLRYEQVVDRVNAAMERGRISQERGAQIISLAQQKYMAAATTTAALSSATEAFGASSARAASQGSKFGYVAQSAGFQIQDFAVQVAAGTSAVTAFAQQAPQFLGIFGTAGAIAGAVVAVGAVAFQFLGLSSNAKAAAEATSYFDSVTQSTLPSIQAQGNEIDTIASRYSALAKQIGTAASIAARADIANREQVMAQQRAAMQAALDQARFGGLATRNLEEDPTAARRLISRLKLKETAEEIERATAALRAVQQFQFSGNVQELVEALDAAGGRYRIIAEQQAGVMVNYVREAKAIELLRAQLAVLEDTATDAQKALVSVSIGDRSAEIARRDRARAEDAAAAAQQAFTDRIRQTILQLDPAAAAAERYADQQLLLRTALEDGMIAQDQYTALLATAGAAYDGATRTVDRYGEALDQQAQRLREQLDPNVAYAAELERIGELYRTNRISVEEYAAADEAARNRIFRQTERVDDATRQLGFTFQSAFEDAIVKGDKLRNVLAGIAQDVARIIIRQTVTTPLAGLVTGGIGSLFGGTPAYSAPSPVDLGLPGFADGGPVSGGRPIVVGEEGPEVFVPHSAGQIIPNGESMGGTVVHQTINISVGVAQTVRAEIAALMPAIKRQTIDAVADARMRGGSFAAAMGT